MLNLRKMLSRFLSDKRKETFLKLLKGDTNPKVSIRNAVVGSTFQIYNPESGHIINAIMLRPDYWSCWTTTSGNVASPVNFFTDRELCNLIAREATTVVDGAELTVVDPGKCLSFYGK